MLLKSKIGRTALGLVGGLAVLAFGIITMGALEPAPRPMSADDTMHAVNLIDDAEEQGCSLASRLDERVPAC